MSSVNRSLEKRKYKDTRVNKDLFRRNSKILDNFCLWYPDYAKEYPTLPASIDKFFAIDFVWTSWVWWEYFYDCGIDIAVGENKAYVFFNDNESSIYKHLSARKEIFYIDLEH